MGLFGKKNEGDEDRTRKGLFGSRDKSKSSAPPANNPYANQAQRPVDPYTQAKVNAGLSPPISSEPAVGRAGNLPGRDVKGGGGYGANRYGNENGYGGAGALAGPGSGGNPYGSTQATSGGGRPGGYGGLGRTSTYDDDQNRGDLFKGAQESAQRRQDSGPPAYDYQSEQQGGAGRAGGAYGDRQLTAEEEEEADIDRVKDEIRDMKRQDVASTRNILATLSQAEETGRDTLARLGVQGEMLYNTSRNMDLSQSEITNSKEKTDALKRYNRSMFVPADNPFQSKSAKDKRDQKIMDRHIDERERREEGRLASYRHDQKMQQNFQTLDRNGKAAGVSGPNVPKRNLAQRAKYQFEADEEDDQMEDEIEDNLDEIHRGVKSLRFLSEALGNEVDSQNKVITEIGMKSDRVDNSVHMQTERLKRIK